MLLQMFRGLFVRFYKRLHRQADQLNRSNIKDSIAQSTAKLPASQKLSLLDVGCDDGLWTLELAKAARSHNASLAITASGMDIFEERAKLATGRGIQVSVANAADTFPYPDASFDLIHANQVIEHVPNVDTFVSEIFRTLKPGGTAIISSENASAWHNIFAALMGWQIFSLTNVSAKAGAIGNPLALHNGADAFCSSWTHKTIFNYQGYRDLFRVHHFEDVHVIGAGYHPLPAIFGKWDPRHAHFITAVARKPLANPAFAAAHVSEAKTQKINAFEGTVP